MRRDIERGLKEGEILCVVSTNALELGIDIGELDAVVCAGYPGSIAGTWQRFGSRWPSGATGCPGARLPRVAPSTNIWRKSPSISWRRTPSRPCSTRKTRRSSCSI